MATKDNGIFVGRDDGIVLTNPIGGQMALKASDQDTGGAYCVYENTLPPGALGPRPHVHRKHTETFYVLEGELTLHVGTRTITAQAGSLAVVPSGVVHQPSNPSTLPTRVLLIYSPAGMDRCFVEAAERHIPLQTVPTDPVVLEALAEFADKYGLEFAGFPTQP